MIIKNLKYLCNLIVSRKVKIKFNLKLLRQFIIALGIIQKYKFLKYTLIFYLMFNSFKTLKKFRQNKYRVFE